MIKVYNDKHFQWVLDNFRTHKDSAEMAKSFQLEFNIVMTAQKMRSLWKRLDLKKNNQHKYTKEQDAWIVNNHMSTSINNLVKKFNNKFNVNISYNAFGQHIRKTLKLKYDNQNIFNNKIPGNKRPIKSERIDTRGNIMIKIKNQKYQFEIWQC